MSNLLINEPPLQVLPSLAKEIGLNESIVLQQIHYWMGNKKVGKWHDDKKWVRNTVDQWQEDNFPFWSENTIRRTIKKLEEAGYISSANLNKVSYDRTLWYTIDYDAISSIRVNPFTQNEQMEVTNVGKPIPETTTETTTEKNIYSKSTIHHIEYIPEDVIDLRTALVAVVSDQMWEPTESKFNEAAYLLYEQNVTTEDIKGFRDWWKVNTYYKNKSAPPALKTLLQKWKEYKAPPLPPNTDDQYEMIEVDGKLMAQKVTT